jgi:preprotein translocase subunit SecA
MGQSEQRDECLLVARNCSDNVDSYQQRIERLNTEISKGTAVYTENELRILNQKRDAIYEQMRDLLENS